MKKIIPLILVLLFSNITLSQSLVIYKTDQTSVNFELAEVDSITFSMTEPAMALDLAAWECVTTEPVIARIAPAAGVFEQAAEGLKIFGKDNQITTAVHPTAIADNPVMNKSIYLKWQAAGNGGFMNVTIDLHADTTLRFFAYRVTNLTTDHSFAGSQVITEDTWHYTRIAITANTVISTTAIDNYDIFGGTIIQELSTSLQEPVRTFTFGTKANKQSFVVLNEVRIK